MMVELIKALHVIQQECMEHWNNEGCEKCPMHKKNQTGCSVVDAFPAKWKINDEVQKALL